MHPQSARRRTLGIGLSAMLVIAGPTGAASQSTAEEAVEVGNTPTEVLLPGVELLRAEDAVLTRHQDRIEIEITMDTPTPATYVYPDSIPPERQASPELFTLWAFIFNHPETCSSGEGQMACGPDDFTEEIRGGAYGLAGHLTSIDHSGGAFEIDRGTGGRMTLRGEVRVGDPQRPNAPPGKPNFPLENPMGAEVHLAIAPHGQIDPAAFATELYEPAGNPDCGCWWNAFFAPGEA